ncbi:voltage-gated chloride channel family protein [Niabella sp. CC-SYL272]|uniref:voltage-gated chloride channel family protein n=1 Tax=Niabella agricola TaxID=2891571 RepID=UPI001F2793BE|nr:voltage-gated chloride channel family protein [Niabella agricola]MCF3108246.1 voltage-gated chloride channel family protein [Niabella agricola]
MYQFKTEQGKIFYQLAHWTIRLVPLSFVIGSLVALFLWLLDWATHTRWQHLWLLFLLPLAGIFIWALYHYFGKDAEAGNNLVMDEIHEPGGGVPTRMTPLVLAGTIVTHLFGGSAGREGTAVQMGGSIADLFAKWYQLKKEDRSMLLMCGMAAGFGAVFGTPVAGALFAMEVLFIGRMKYHALIPCLISAVLAHIVCSSYGIHHTHYAISAKMIQSVATWVPGGFSFDLSLLLKVIGAGIAFGLAGMAFARCTHLLKQFWVKLIPVKWLIPVAGGLLIIGGCYLLGNFDYLGLGVVNPNGHNSIVSAFTTGGVDTWSWLWKLLFTAVTLSAGFKGGEVTPLFFIGAALGNTLAVLAGAPADLFAGLGFIAVFAAATNTPIACMVMGVELFGGENILYFAVACFTAYYFSGHSGIYKAQRIAVPKIHRK